MEKMEGEGEKRWKKAKVEGKSGGEDGGGG